MHILRRAAAMLFAIAAVVMQAQDEALTLGDELSQDFHAGENG